MPRFAELPLAALEEPARPARTTWSEEAISELAASIRQNGLLEPLGVFQLEGGQYEVIFGHRRLMASRRAPLDPVPCMVYDTHEAAHAMKIAENVDREELTVTDESLYYGRLFEENSEDVDAVCSLVKKPRSYVEGRLLLLRGYDEVFDQLRAGAISLGVASLLNKLDEERDAEFYLDAAVRGGCTVRQMSIWVDQANAAARFARRSAEALAGDNADKATAAPPATPPHPAWINAPAYQRTSSLELVPCARCGRTEEMWRYLRLFFCPPCKADWDSLPSEPAAAEQVTP